MNNFLEKTKIKNIVISIFLTMFFVLDRLLKKISFNLEEDIILLKKILNFTFYPNKYISFSLPISGWWLNFLILLLLIIIIYYLFSLYKQRKQVEFWAWSAIFLGALSNFIDRMFFSYVIDYFDLFFFTVFNLADVLIVFGSFVVIFFNFRFDGFLKK